MPKSAPSSTNRPGKLANSSCFPPSLRAMRKNKTNAKPNSIAGREIDLDELLKDFQINEANPADIADKIEMVTPLMRPLGCGPVAPSKWVVLRTYQCHRSFCQKKGCHCGTKSFYDQRIIEVRDETRMDDNGLAIGDRTFKRCYQRAQRDLIASDMLNEPILDRALVVEPAFRYITDKLWHRYLFPFGTFMYQVSGNGGGGKFEANWRKYMLTAQRDNNLIMNPYSVAAADVLYLCNTGGYLDRYLYLIGVILWAKRHGVNLLMHIRPKHSRPGSCHKANRLDRFFTLPRGSVCCV